jgi:hypothetical protein
VDVLDVDSKQKRTQAMGYPTKVQLISRKTGAAQYDINFPTALAEAMEFQKGEIIEWIIENKANLIAHRPVVPPSTVTLRKKRHAALERLADTLGAVRRGGLLHRLLHPPFARTPAGPSPLPGAPYRHRTDQGLRQA